MTESADLQTILRRISSIENKIDSLDQTTNFALRSEEEKHQETIDKIFGKSKIRAQIYICVDGINKLKDIGEHLHIKSPNIYPEITILKEEGLIFPSSSDSGVIYSKTALENSFRISKYLMEKFHLDKNGLSIG